MIDISNYSLKPHNTFGIEASCRRFLEYATVEEAQQVAQILCDQPSFLIIGGGSNLLLTHDVDGIVVRSSVSGFEVERSGDTALVSVGSGMVWDEVVERCVAENLYGAENLSLIPGDVGASAVQNIGAYGAEVADLIEKIEAVRIADGEVVEILKDECEYGYRQSRFKKEWRNQYLITKVYYRLSLTYRPRLDYGNIRAELERQGIVTPTAHQLREVIIRIRKEKLPDPQIEGNAGSFFMNPVVSKEKYESLLTVFPDMPHYYVDEDHEKIPAGWMIDQCGWKGRTIGCAGVHSRQALVLVNRGGATGQDVLALCRAIQKDVYQRFGVEIIPEVNII